MATMNLEKARVKIFDHMWDHEIEEIVVFKALNYQSSERFGEDPDLFIEGIDRAEFSQLEPANDLGEFEEEFLVLSNFIANDLLLKMSHDRPEDASLIRVRFRLGFVEKIQNLDYIDMSKKYESKSRPSEQCYSWLLSIEGQFVVSQAEIELMTVTESSIKNESLFKLVSKDGTNSDLCALFSELNQSGCGDFNVSVTFTEDLKPMADLLDGVIPRHCTEPLLVGLGAMALALELKFANSAPEATAETVSKTDTATDTETDTATNKEIGSKGFAECLVHSLADTLVLFSYNSNEECLSILRYLQQDEDVYEGSAIFQQYFCARNPSALTFGEEIAYDAAAGIEENQVTTLH